MVLRKQALADAAGADRRRAAGRARPAAGRADRRQGRRRRRGRADDVRRGGPGAPGGGRRRGGAPAARRGRGHRRQDQHAASSVSGRSPAGPAFGHTRNPWSRNHTPGGSSGGSAAAVAAGLVTAAIGSDGAGSVRIPAAWTHLVGIKPQRGRISTWPLPEAFNGITVNGVLARTVADAALRARRRVGQRRRRPAQAAPIQAAEAVGTCAGTAARSRCRPSSRSTSSGPSCNPEIRAALHAVGGQLTELGHTIVGRPTPTTGVRDVVELPVPVDVGAAGLGGPARPRRRAGPAHRRAISAWAGCCRRACCARPAPRRPPHSAASARSSISST